MVTLISHVVVEMWPFEAVFSDYVVGVFLTIVEEIFVSIDFYNLTLNRTVYVPRLTHSSFGFVIVQ